MSYTTKKLTNIEFTALARNADGDLVNMYDNFLSLTIPQVESLTSDDYSRYYDYMEELNYELVSLTEEFGV